MGFQPIASLAQQHPGVQVLIRGGPELTAVQTTHPWPDHLGPWLRREGLDREVYSTPEELQPGPYLLVDFDSPAPDSEVPLVGASYAVSVVEY
jgi:hypothetical protein